MAATGTDGYVNKVWFGINFDPRMNDVNIEICNTAGAFGARMGDGTIIPLKNPSVVRKTRSSCVIQFDMDTPYPSNSPCQMVYRTTQAYITITET